MHIEVQSGKGPCPPHLEWMRIVTVPDGRDDCMDLYTEASPTRERL